MPQKLPLPTAWLPPKRWLDTTTTVVNNDALTIENTLPNVLGNSTTTSAFVVNSMLGTASVAAGATTAITGQVTVSIVLVGTVDFTYATGVPIYATVSSGGIVTGLIAGGVVLAGVAVVASLMYLKQQQLKKIKERSLAKKTQNIRQLDNEIKQLSHQINIQLKQLNFTVANQQLQLQQAGKVLKNGAISYTIKKGDTLSKIAKKFNTTVEKIVENNALKSGNKHLIFPNEVIKVPQGQVTQQEKRNQTLAHLPSLQKPTNLSNTPISEEIIDFPNLYVLGTDALLNRIAHFVAENRTAFTEGLKHKDEAILLDMLGYMYQDSPKKFLEKLASYGMLKFIDEAIQNTPFTTIKTNSKGKKVVLKGYYDQLHEVFLNGWKAGAKEDDTVLKHLTNVNEVLKNENATLQQLVNEGVIPYSNVGLVKGIVQKATPYSVTLTDEGKILFEVEKEYRSLAFLQHVSTLGNVLQKATAESATREFDAFEPVTILLETDAAKFPNLKKGSQITVPAYTLKLLENEQNWDRFDEALNIALVALSVLNPVGASIGAATWAIRAEQAVALAMGIANAIKKDYQAELLETEAGRALLRALEVVETVQLIYGATELLTNGSKLLQNLEDATRNYKNTSEAVPNKDIIEKSEEVLTRIIEERTKYWNEIVENHMPNKSWDKGNTIFITEGKTIDEFLNVSPDTYNEMKSLYKSEADANRYLPSVIASGSSIPEKIIAKEGDVFYKIVESGSNINSPSPFYITAEQLNIIKENPAVLEQILGLPLHSVAPKYDVYSITLIAPETSIFQSKVAKTKQFIPEEPTKTVYETTGGATQTLIIDNSEKKIWEKSTIPIGKIIPQSLPQLPKN